MKKDLSDYLFKTIFAKHAIKDMQASGSLRSPLSSKENQNDVDIFAPVSEAVRSGSIHMQRCYQYLFILENTIREFVSDVLNEKSGENWFEILASRDMKKKVEDRKTTEAKNQWHSGRNPHPLYYLDFGDLALFIQSHWNEFKDLLPSQAWAVSRLQDIEKTRNVIAHTNILSSEESTRLEIQVKDWIRQIR